MASIRAAVMVFLVLFAGAASIGERSMAQVPSATANPQQAIRAALAAARKVQMAGPTGIKLADQGVLRLPVGYAFIPVRESQQLLRAMGNVADPNLIGGVLNATDKDPNWLVVIRFLKTGHIRDDDARSWSADELLSGMRKATEAANEERRSRDIAELEITGWIDKPTYDPVKRRLIWSIAIRKKGTADPAGVAVNYNAYALGREGYFSLGLMTSLRQMEQHKLEALRLLDSIEYDGGRRYVDFMPSQDKVAEFGLRALIHSLATEELGLLAILKALVVKFWKALALAAVVLIGGVAKVLFDRSRSVG